MPKGSSTLLGSVLAKMARVGFTAFFLLDLIGWNAFIVDTFV
jgi:hypothetical protein